MRNQYLQLDKQGYFINSIKLTDVDFLWLEPVLIFKNKIVEILNNKILSIYLRGSVAENKAIKGFSDIDIILVTSMLVTQSETVAIQSTELQLVKSFSFIKRIDLTTIVYNDIFKPSSRAYDYQFVVKVLSVKLYGRDIAQELPNFNFDNLIFSQLPYIVKKIQITSSIVMAFTEQEHIKIKYWSSWIFRAIIRAGFEKTIKSEKKYSRELDINCQIFSKYFPDCSSKMKKALCYAVNPIESKKEILSLLSFFEKWFLEHNEKL